MKKLHFLYFWIFFTSVFLALQEGYCMDTNFYSCEQSVKIADYFYPNTITDATMFGDDKIVVSLSNGQFIILDANTLKIYCQIPLSKYPLKAINKMENENFILAIDEASNAISININDEICNYEPRKTFLEKFITNTTNKETICPLKNGNMIVKKDFAIASKEKGKNSFFGSLISLFDKKENRFTHKIAPSYPFNKIIPLDGNRCLALVNQSFLQILDFNRPDENDVEIMNIYNFSMPIADLAFLHIPESNKILIAAMSFDGILSLLQIEIKENIEEIEPKFFGSTETNIENINKIILLRNDNFIFVQNNGSIKIYDYESNKVIQKINPYSYPMVSVLPLKNRNFLTIYRNGKIKIWEQIKSRVHLNVVRSDEVDDMQSLVKLNATPYYKEPLFVPNFDSDLDKTDSGNNDDIFTQEDNGPISMTIQRISSISLIDEKEYGELTKLKKAPITIFNTKIGKEKSDI